jgi:hypothetical protein
MINLETLVEVKLTDDENFLKVRETLSRIGVSSKKEKILYQSCHILHKQGQYYIVHFKELFALDGKPSNFSEEDIGRRNTIANLIAEWGLVTLVDPAKSKEPVATMAQIKVIPFREKGDWELTTKYNIGRKS